MTIPDYEHLSCCMCRSCKAARVFTQSCNDLLLCDDWLEFACRAHNAQRAIAKDLVDTAVLTNRQVAATGVLSSSAMRLARKRPPHRSKWTDLVVAGCVNNDSWALKVGQVARFCTALAVAIAALALPQWEEMVAAARERAAAEIAAGGLCCSEKV